MGKPIAMDMSTKERRQLAFAGVRVEISGDSLMHSLVNVPIKGCDFIVSITYECKPKRCSLCHYFGHSSGKCQNLKGPTKRGRKVGSERIGKMEKKVNWKPMAPSPPSEGGLEEGEVASLTGGVEGTIEEGDFTVVARRRRERSPKVRQKAVLGVEVSNHFNSLQVIEEEPMTSAFVETNPSPLMMIDVLGGQSGPIGEFEVACRGSHQHD